MFTWYVGGVNKNHFKHFKAGSVWRYRTRPQEQESTLTILAVEGTICHIRIDDINLRNKNVAGGIQSYFPHVPISLEALQASVTEQIDNTEITEMPDGYTVWQEQQGGVFSLDVAEILTVIEEMLR